MRIIKLYAIHILIAGLSLSCNSPMTHSDAMEFGFKGNVKSILSKTHLARGFSQNCEDLNSCEHSNTHILYFNKLGNLDSSILFLQDDSSLTLTVYNNVEGRKLGYNKYNKARQRSGHGTFDWVNQNKYVDKQFDYRNKKVNEITYTLNDSFRHETTETKNFDSSEKMIRHLYQIFDFASNGDLEGYRIENKLENTVSVQRYHFETKDSRGNPVRVSSLNNSNNFRQVTIYEYVYY